MSTLATYLKLGAATAIVGAIVAGAISFTLPRRYVSVAVMRLTPQAVPGEPAWQIGFAVARNLQEMQQDLLSRSSLTEIVQRPGLDLYRKERAIQPMEDVIQEMRNRDLQIKGLPPRDVRISFEYPDRAKAQAVVREVTTRFSGPAVVLTPASLPEKPSQPDRLAITGIGFGVGLALGLLFVFLRQRGLKWTLLMAGCTVAGFFLAVAVWILMPDTFADDQKSYQLMALGAFTGLALGAFRLRDRRTGGNHYARLIAFSAACGAIAGGLVSFVLPERYVSTALLRAAPPPAGYALRAQAETEYADLLRHVTEDILSRGNLAELIQNPSPDLHREGRSRLSEERPRLTGDVLSRGSVSELIQRPSLDLYREERFRRPLEDIVHDMRHRDLRITPVRPGGTAGLGPISSLEISFEYRDRDKAQAVVSQLVSKFMEGWAAGERKVAIAQDVAGRNPRRDPTSGGLTPEVLDPPSLPASPISPNRPAVAAIGLLAGLLLGSLLALHRWLAARQAATPGPHPSYWKYTLAAGAIGALAAGLGSFAIPSRYVSTAVLRLVPYPAGSARTSHGEIESTALLRELTEGLLSRGSLAGLIQRPSLDLYRRERSRRPMEDIVDDMRHRDLRITPTSPAGFTAPGHLTTFEISFEYGDGDKAQAVVRELVTKFTEGFASAERTANLGNMSESPELEALEVLDSASLPGSPVSPNRTVIAGIGLLAGLLLGSLLARRRRLAVRRQAAKLGPHPSYWKYALAATVLGAITAGLAFFVIPSRYVSTAVLRLVSADLHAPENAEAAAGRMQGMFQQVLSRDSLSEIVVRPALQLYAPERRRRSLDEVVKQMRDRDLRVEPLRDGPFGGRPTAFRISFEYSDPGKARACVLAVVSKFVDGSLPWKPDAVYVGVLDLASMPEYPVSPNRGMISAAGGLAGLLLGIALARARVGQTIALCRLSTR